MNLRLLGLFTLKSPLSHIGESISTTSYLVEEPMLQPDGSLEPVFCYSGNAWRGQLRDQAATYMLEHLGSPRLAPEAFHLLYSGGRIGGEQSINIEQARVMRRTVPMIAVWGGGIGNQILPGKMRVSNAYPVCAEAVRALPDALAEQAAAIPYRGLTFEKSFSRKDDAKDERLTQFLDTPALPPAAQTALFGDAPATKAVVKDGPADQMRMTVELLAAGVQLWSSIDLLDVSELEVGCLVSALHTFSRSPHIGGQANKGHGRVDLTYEMLDLDTGALCPFLSVRDGVPLLTPPASKAKDAYDQHLRTLYDELLARQGGEIRALLGVAS